MKSLIIIAISFSLVGCAGYRSVEPVLDPTTGLPVKNILGMVKTKKVKKTETVAMLDALSPIAAGISAKVRPSCDSRDTTGMTEQAEVAYYEAVKECFRSREMSNMMAYALGRPTTDVQAISQAMMSAVKSVQQGKTDRTRGIITGVASLGTSIVLGSAAKAAFDGLRDVGVEASRNGGDIAVGSVAVNNSQQANSSNDPIGGSGAGEAGAGGASTSSTDTNLTSSPETNINIGRGQRQFITNTSDTARSFVDSSQNQIVEPSGNATQNNGRSSGLLNADENNESPLDSNDSDGNLL